MVWVVWDCTYRPPVIQTFRPSDLQFISSDVHYSSKFDYDDYNKEYYLKFRHLIGKFTLLNVAKIILAELL